MALYALTVAMAGFAHAALPMPNSAKADLSAFVLPDGKLPTLCLDDRTDGKTTPAVKITCDACLLRAGGGVLPSEVGMADHVESHESTEMRPFDAVRPCTASHYVAHLRGPPGRHPVA